ncbi:alpha/beta fold hydrolase [Legionella sp. D16C41]|uniref:alpha/beta fold hydrolase n=1 Tax=Legionella sp. D16C41 TaxID=3402688 RepID=UPI003AF575E6
MRRQKSLLSFLFIAFLNIATSASILPLDNKKFIAYTDEGQGTPLILIHAFPTDKQLWKPQTELKQSFRVISLDLWGFGQSSPADGNAISMADYAAEVKTLLDHLQIKKAIIGGESMGGYIALAFLKLYPQAVEGLVLSNTQAIADSDEAKINREKIAQEVLEHGTEKLINGFIENALSPNASNDMRAQLLDILQSQKPTALASALRGMSLRASTEDLLAHSTLPILIITSEEDKVISPQQSEAMHQLAKNSKLVILANAGHLSSFEQPEQWNQAVKEMFFLPH